MAGPFAGRLHPPIRQITDILTFRLARLVAVNERAGARWAGREFGLSLNEWRVLGLVHALGPIRTGQIAQMLMMDKGQLSRVVKRMVDRGYLSSEPDATDARAMLLEITEAGDEVHEKLLHFAAERNERVVEPLSREECDLFIQLLGKLIDHNYSLLEGDGHPAQ